MTRLVYAVVFTATLMALIIIGLALLTPVKAGHDGPPTPRYVCKFYKGIHSKCVRVQVCRNFPAGVCT